MHRGWTAVLLPLSIFMSDTARGQAVDTRIEDWVQHVSRRQLVCTGVVESATPVTWPEAKSLDRLCGGSTSDRDGKRLRLSIDSVLVGAIDDRTFEVRTPAPQGSAPGTRIIFWGARMCSDGWHAWGQTLMVHDDGTVVLFSESLGGRRIEGRLTAAEFLDRVRRAADGRRSAWTGRTRP